MRDPQANVEEQIGDNAGSNGRLLAWTALVVVSALLIVGIRLTYDVPPDLRYRYSTVVFAMIISTLQFVLMVRIAGGSDQREMFALERPSWSWRRVTVALVVIVIGMAVLVLSVPFLQQGESEGNGAPFDPDRAIPFVLNAIVLVVVSPVLEELLFRGLGFKLLERFGQSMAIVLTAVAFALFHGQFLQLPALVLFGAAMGYLRSRTGSIYPCIATHVVANLLGVAAALAV